MHIAARWPAISADWADRRQRLWAAEHGGDENDALLLHCSRPSFDWLRVSRQARAAEDPGRRSTLEMKMIRSSCIV